MFDIYRAGVGDCFLNNKVTPIPNVFIHVAVLLKHVSCLFCEKYCSFKKAEPAFNEDPAHFFVYLLPTSLSHFSIGRLGSNPCE